MRLVLLAQQINSLFKRHLSLVHMKKELSTKDDPPEFCRRAIQEALDKNREK